ncbi:MAG: cytochrome c3 family protein [Candidatus Krumholzibacteria bacterium]|nr:cytochrome c3 family protein [Candidatus Krumholzibacteria bacterium]
MARIFALAPVLILSLTGAPRAADPANDTCFDCHSDDSDPDLPFVDGRVFGRSVHRDLACTDCHDDVDPDDLPHDEQLESVYCGDCHDDQQLDFDASIHGQALNRKQPYAPTCTECHGMHDILSPADESSRTFKMNVPYLCGQCHREGAPVANTYKISEHNILENYSQSIHGEGLFKKGLLVTAACTDCHRAHMILPHTEPRASISPRNITATCVKCHARIEQVHVKVIRGELWEKAPGAIPACTDCHVPHRARRESVSLNISDRDCMKCHERHDVFKVAEGDTLSMTVDRELLKGSAHTNIPCVKCHVDVDPRRKRPCEPSGLVDCSSCHAKIAEEYVVSGHGQAHEEGIEQAPYCTTCHGGHGALTHRSEDSPTYRASVPALCGDCHRAEGKALGVTELSQSDALADYSHSVHGRGLVEKGLLPSAICIDCHSSHMVLKHTDARSTVSHDNLPATCATCHRGIYKDYIKSVHYASDSKDADKLPTCATCHSSHTIGEVSGDAFVQEVTHQCGSCHDELAETYLDTMHGKAYRLGYLDAAKCSDCHGAHHILAVNDPASAVGHRNIVATCQQCHADANQRFTGYLTHATHHDPDKYPFLYYSYWAMTFLLIGVFSFFGVHTLLWLPRSFRHMLAHRKEAVWGEPRYYIRRFTRPQRITHLFVVSSFLLLALTGMMLKFSSMPWAAFIANMLGGVKGAGVLHRIAAVTTFGYFAFHIIALVRYKRSRRLKLTQLIFGADSLMFNRKDLSDFWGTIKWFFNAGPRPRYGRWTYWEKFDYLAVFWGVAIIGLSGLMLWLPVLFTKLLPGAVINVATIIHSDEALLAVGFIFTIHFFNTHLRPEAFPMDTVVFTGLVPLEHFMRDRPREYDEMKQSGELRKRLVKKTLTRRYEIGVRVMGGVFLGVGLILITLIIYSMLFGYK